MKQTISLFWIFFFSLSSLFCKGNVAEITIPFYSETVRVHYTPTLLSAQKVRLGYADRSTGKQEAERYYEQLKRWDDGVLLEDLKKYKIKYALNDWFYYELLTKVVDKIAKSKTKRHQTLLKWYLLNESGYDCRITYMEHSTYLNIYTDDELYDVPILTEGMRNYANLTSWDAGKAMQRSLYMLDYAPNPRGESFSFALEQLPQLRAKKKTRTVKFETRTQEYKVKTNLFETKTQAYEITFDFDQTAVDIMKKYPTQAEGRYLTIPFSETVQQSLLPQLKKIIADKSKKEALEIIVSFTRSAFNYKKDEDYFGRSRPMTAEEVFHYPYSDCEDRCALFYAITKSLLDYPMIVMAYDDHVTVAVGAERLKGEIFSYGNKKYVVCDPTGPSNSSEIGYFPKGYKQRSFEVIARYK